LSRQPFVWHVHRSVRFCVSPDKHHRHSRRLPYDRRATVHNIRREVVMARTLIPTGHVLVDRLLPYTGGPKVARRCVSRGARTWRRIWRRTWRNARVRDS
jgi:hypothetical protein